MLSRERTILLSVTCLGISSIISQIVLLREFLTVFSGNELVIGLILCNWLLLTGMGSLLGMKCTTLKNPLRLLIACQTAIAILPLVQLGAVRSLNLIHATGRIPGLTEILASSLLILLPYCLTSGFLLTLFAGLSGESGDAGQVGRVYVLDVFGDIIGGLLFSFLLVFFFSSCQVLIFLFLLNMGAALLVSRSVAARSLSVFCLVLMGLGLVIFGLTDLEQYTGRLLFPDQEVLYREMTPYGSLTLTRNNSQLNMYENGVVSGSTGDITAAEENVHLALSLHPHPENVLLISGGLNGSLQEILKYRDAEVDYVEVNPAVLELVKKMGNKDKRVTMHAADGRLHVRSSSYIYDAILMDLSDPVSAQLNRFYTSEFFAEVRHALKPGGVFSFSLSGTENYAGEELRQLASAIHASLAMNFQHILLVPGSRLFFISSNREIRAEFADRLIEKGIPTRFVRAEYLGARLTDDRLAAAEQMVSEQVLPNRDFRPATYFTGLQYWLSRFQSNLALPVLLLLVSMGAALAIIIYSPVRPAAFAIYATGFAGMGLEVVLLIIFQVFYGYLYQQMGILITSFLLGTALGAAWYQQSGRDPRLLLIGLETRLVLFSFLLIPLLIGIQKSPLFVHGALVANFLFPLLTCVTGFLVGGQFPVIARMAFAGPEKTAASLYSLDFLGGAMGALLVSSFLIPLGGIINTCLVIGSVKLISLAGLVLSRSPVTGVIRQRNEPVAQLVLLFVLLVFSALGFLIVRQETSASLYGLSYMDWYHWTLLALLCLGMYMAVKEIWFPGISTAASAGTTVMKKTGIALLRWIFFAFFSLVVFFPIFRCYFQVPFLFCHACPRKCVFGYLRPYLVPAALIMNLERRYWCFNCCPVGTMFDCQAKAVVSKPWQMAAWMKLLPIVVLVMTVFSYFKVESDLKGGGLPFGDWFTVLYKNQFSVSMAVIAATVMLLIIALKVRRSFCELLCPVGTLSDLILKVQKMKGTKAISMKVHQL
jgi:spermidine synthase